MKRFFKGLFLSLLTVSIIASSGFAVFVLVDTSGYDIFNSDDIVLSNLFISLKEKDGIAFANVDYKSHYFQYQVEISYDDLASKVMLANENGFICSLYKNVQAGYWVGYVNDIDYNVFDGGEEISGTLCNGQGYVYVVEIDTTGEDSVDLLTQILVRLTLVESYVKSAYFELWEQGGVLDDIYSLFSRVGALLEDIKSRLYYNSKSAAYYLYMIESHLSDIASNSGSSGSSSGTDLTGVLEWLETATGLLGLIQIRTDALLSSLGVSNEYLYQVSTKLDGVSTMVTDLARAKTYLSSIDSDVEDVLSELETATGLIGLMQVDVDALVTAQGVSHDLLAELSTKLTTMIEKQETAFDYLSDLSGDLGTVISNQSAVLSLQQSANLSLSWIESDLADLSGDLGTVISNQSAVLSLQQSANLSLSWIESDLADLSGDLGTVISNQNAVLPLMQEASSKLSSIYDALLYNDKEAAQYLYMINYNMHSRLDSMIGNQEAILALLQADGAFTTDLSGVLADLGTVISNQSAALPVLQEIAEYLSYLKSNHYSYSIYQELGSVESALSNLLALLQQEGIFTTDISGILANQQEVSTMLSNIENSLVYRESEVGRTLYLLNVNFLERAEILISNQEAILALLQADGAFTTDLSGVLAALGTVISNQSAALPVLQSVSDSLSTISSRLYYVDASVSYYVYNISYQLRDKLPILISNQEAILALLQQDGAFTTDISGILADLDTMISNQGTVLPVLQEVSSKLSSIYDALLYNDREAAEYLYMINYNMYARFDSVIGNQEAILALLQQDGAFTTDLSGVLANQQELNTTLSNIDNVLSAQGVSAVTYLALIDDTVNLISSNIRIMSDRQQSINEKLISYSGYLAYKGLPLANYAYQINDNLVNKLATVTGNQEIGLENQQKLIDLIEDLELTTNVTIENIENITIDVTNKAYEVFYITDSEGNKQNISDFSGDVLSVGGRLLNFFFKVAFDDALDSVDAALDDMTEFYIDDSVLVGGGSLWE